MNKPASTIISALFFLVLSFVFHDCKKDNQVKPLSVSDPCPAGFQNEITGPQSKVEPLPYFPVYPGSWWRYVNRDGTISTYTTEPNYVHHEHVIRTLCGCETPGEKFVIYSCEVPVYQGRAIFGYDNLIDVSPHLSCSPNQFLEPFFSETVGNTWQLGGYDKRYQPANMRMFRKVLRKFKSGEDSIIELKDYYTWRNTVTWSQYAKNKGLIFQCEVDTTKMDTLYSIRLTEYFINH